MLLVSRPNSMLTSAESRSNNGVGTPSLFTVPEVVPHIAGVESLLQSMPLAVVLPFLRDVIACHWQLEC